MRTATWPEPKSTRREAVRARSALAALARTEPLAAVLGASVGVIAANSGGYWPTSWGWGASIFGWVAAMAVLLRTEVRISRLQWTALGLVAAVAAWWLLSSQWSSAPWRAVLESERALVYVTALAAVVLLVRSRSYRMLLGGLLASFSVVLLYSLGTRLLPDRLGVFDPVAGYRLSSPLGYWNALGLAAALSTLLALGFVSRGRSPVARALSAAALLVTIPTLYFTFSRGSWVALGIGIAAMVAIDTRRLQLVTTLLLVLPAPAVAVALAYRSDALTHPQTSLAAAAHDGHRVALAVVGLALANFLLGLALAFVERRVVLPPRLRLAYGAVLACGVVAAIVLVVAHYGGPGTVARHAYRSFKAPPVTAPKSLNQRLFTFSSNGRIELWSAAWHDAQDHSRLGSGAGTYELYWLAHRKSALDVRDAHSLYMEVLAELGPIGLALITMLVLVPLAAAVRARRRALVPAAAGAYLAWVLHAGVDWDWEMTGLTLMGLFCGGALLSAARSEDLPTLSWRIRGPLAAALVAVVAFAFVGLAANLRLSSARHALASGRYAVAEDRARDATHWMPWSPEPWQVVAESRYDRRQDAAARRYITKALEKDTSDWQYWLDLAYVTRGDERRDAVVHALQLNPFNQTALALARSLRIPAPSRPETQ